MVEIGEKNTVRWAFGKDERLGNATNWKCLLTEVPTNRNIWAKNLGCDKSRTSSSSNDISNRNIWNIPPGTPKYKYERSSCIKKVLEGLGNVEVFVESKPWCGLMS